MSVTVGLSERSFQNLLKHTCDQQLHKREQTFWHCYLYKRHC